MYLYVDVHDAEGQPQALFLLGESVLSFHHVGTLD